MTQIERRIAQIALELRDDGRTLVGTAIPYGQPTQVGNYTETFVRGAFADTNPGEVPLLVMHNRDSLPIGRAITLTETDHGLDVEARVSETHAGDEVLTLIRDGAVGGLSVGFRPIRDVWDRAKTRVERVKAQLVELSVTAFPAYEGAKIMALRSEDEVARTPRLTVARWL